MALCTFVSPIHLAQFGLSAAGEKLIERLKASEYTSEKNDSLTRMFLLPALY